MNELGLDISSLLTISSYFTSIISAVVGMSGGIVLLSIMTFFLPVQTIIPIHGIVQLVSNSTRTYLLKSYVNTKILKYFIIGLPFGAALATYVIKSITHPEYLLLIIAGLIFYTLFRPKNLPHLTIPYPGFIILGFFVGFLGPLVGATGPFLAPFFLRDDLNKEQIIATKASVQLMGHLIKIPTFLFVGFAYMDYIEIVLAMTVATVLGTRTGVYFLKYINEFIFRLIFKTALFLAGARLIYKVCDSYFY